MCLDVLLEIAKYLSLNETIHTFSTSILSALRRAQNKVHLVDPSKRLIEVLPQHLDQQQITSIRLTKDLVRPNRAIPFASFTQLISLTLLNPSSLHTLDQYLPHFPTASAVSLWFEGEFQFQPIFNRWQSSFTGVTRLQIRCAGACCDHFESPYQGSRYAVDTTITSFIFDSGHYPLHPCHFCSRNDPVCFFRSAVEFIRSLVNIRRVRFVTDRLQLETFLQVDRWQELIRACVHLERVILQLLDHAELTEEANTIERQLRQIRSGMIFRIRTA